MPEYEINLLPTQGRGARFGKTRLGFNGTFPEGYDATCNMTSHEGRSMAPSFAPSGLFNLASKQPPVGVIPWEDSSQVPTAVILVDSGVKLAKNAAITDEADDTTAEYQSGVLFDDGNGTPLILAGTKTGSKLIQDRTQAGVWDENAGCVATFVVVAGADFYRVINDYQVKKWTGVSPPTTDANYGAAYNVGDSSSKFTAVGSLGDAPVFGKTDGRLYMFDEAADSFAPVFETAPHPHNFPCIAPNGRGGILTATWDGTFVEVTRDGDVRTYHPHHQAADRDTPRDRWAWIATNGQEIYALAWPAQRLTQNLGIRAFVTTDTGSTYTEYSEEVTDQRADTFMDLSSLALASDGDWILVKADGPYLLLNMDVLGANTAASRLRVRLINNSATLSGFTIDPAYIFNGTDTDPAGAGKPIAQDGYIAVKQDQPTPVLDAVTAAFTEWRELSITINGEAVSGWWWMLFLE